MRADVPPDARVILDHAEPREALDPTPPTPAYEPNAGGALARGSSRQHGRAARSEARLAPADVRRVRRQREHEREPGQHALERSVAGLGGRTSRRARAGRSRPGGARTHRAYSMHASGSAAPGRSAAPRAGDRVRTDRCEPQARSRGDASAAATRIATTFAAAPTPCRRRPVVSSTTDAYSSVLSDVPGTAAISSSTAGSGAACRRRESSAPPRPRPSTAPSPRSGARSLAPNAVNRPARRLPRVVGGARARRSPRR